MSLAKNNKLLVVLLGPTGIGKTELSLSLAQHLCCPIINCDSRQLFRGLEIGTAAPTPEEQQRARHYFVGTLDIHDYYSAAMYEADVMQTLNILFKEQDTVLLSGGSMMYIDAVCNGIDNIPTVDEETRITLKTRYEQEGLEPLLQELSLLDPEYYAIVDRKNTRRIIHALEICYMTGKSFTSFRTNEKRHRPFHILKIGLERPREELFGRINRRVEQMLQNGMIEEAQRMYPHRNTNALNTVGYKELFAWMDGKMTLEQASLRMQKNTRVYAKKQMTWFAHDKDIHWFHPSQEADIKQYITEWKNEFLR